MGAAPFGVPCRMYASLRATGETSSRAIRPRVFGDVLPVERKRLSRRAIDKKLEREDQQKEYTLRRTKEQKALQEQADQRGRSPAFSKSPKELWAKPTAPKYVAPERPADQESNFRYRQNPVMQIRDLALAGKAEEALALFKQEVCVHHKDRIDQFTYNQLILACSRSGKWNLGFKTYNDMKKRAVAPNIITVTNLLNCLAGVTYPTKEEKIKYTKQKVEYIANEMEKHKIRPNAQSYNVMLKVLGAMEDLPSALRLVNEMQMNPEVEVDDTTYTLLVNAFGPDNLAGVFSVWDDLKERNIKASGHFYHAMMKYCNIHKKPELALEISLQMLDEGLQWDQRTLSILCTSYGLLGQASYAGVLLKKVDESSIPMDSILWNNLLRLGSMKVWKISRGPMGMADIHSSEDLIAELEKRLLASKAAPSTIEKTADILKTDELEALLLASINCTLPENAKRFYSLVKSRRKVRAVSFPFPRDS